MEIFVKRALDKNRHFFFSCLNKRIEQPFCLSFPFLLDFSEVLELSQLKYMTICIDVCVYQINVIPDIMPIEVYKEIGNMVKIDFVKHCSVRINIWLIKNKALIISFVFIYVNHCTL